MRTAAPIVPAPLLLLLCCAAPDRIAAAPAAYTLTTGAGDPALAVGLQPVLDAGIARVQEYFGVPFRQPFQVVVLPDRKSFTAALPAAWGMPKTECWMVASGVADALRLLSPRAWRTDACEHDPDDAMHVRQIVAHELTHVYHGQRNPTRDFTGVDAIGWFVEGLAVLVSGQLEAGHREAARKAVATGAVPAELEVAWSGPCRYGISGTMVEYLERLVGRRGLLALLAATDEATILAAAGRSEAEFLLGWAEFVRHGAVENRP